MTKYEPQKPTLFVYDSQHNLTGAFAFTATHVYYAYRGGRYGTFGRKATRDSILCYRSYAQPTTVVLDLIYEHTGTALHAIRKLTENPGKFTWDKFLTFFEPEKPKPLPPRKEDGRFRISLEQQEQAGAPHAH